MKMRHTPPQDRHEEAIVAEIGKAEAALRRAADLCQQRAYARTEEGQSLKDRYKHTHRSIMAAADAIRAVRGFGSLPKKDVDNGDK